MSRKAATRLDALQNRVLAFKSFTQLQIWVTVTETGRTRSFGKTQISDLRFAI